MIIEQSSQLSFLHYQYKYNQIMNSFSTFVQEKEEFWIKLSVSSKFILWFSTANAQSILQNAVVKETLSEVQQMHDFLHIYPSSEVWNSL